MKAVILAAIFAFFVAAILGKPFIARLRQMRVGQITREAGPESHQAKTGTPTMGGVLILFGTTAAALAFAGNLADLWPLFVAFLGYGFIGIVDDLSKLTAKRSLGLKARQKLLLQVIFATIVVWAAWQQVGTALHVPFLGRSLEVPLWLYFIIGVGTMVGTGNAVNLADGLDGLAAGTTAIASFTLATMAFRLGFDDVAIFAAAVGGACLGFAWFNAHPAQLFMGDTGSLALGGGLAAIALLSRTPLLLIIVGGMFVVITLSVIIQVTYFRLSGGRRLFRMSPLHHHFELSGWSEPQVVIRFWLVALLFAAAGMLALQ